MSVTCANVMYLLLFALMTVVAFLMQEWGAPSIDIYSFNIGCKDIPNIDVSACKGENAVYRISLGMMLWFLLNMFGNCCSKRFHTGLWGIKIGSLLIMTTGLFFTPLIGQDGYVQFARAVSALFLVTQLIYFVDAAYHWNAYFADRAYGDQFEENRNWVALALMTCFFMMLAVAISIILLYIFFHHCERQTVFITVTLLLIIIATVSQLNIDDTDSSLITSCIVSAYATYLCWSAVSSDECNPEHRQPVEQKVIAFSLSAFSLLWSCYSAGTRNTTHATLINELSQDEEDDSDEETIDDSVEETIDGQSMILFHASMATGAVYMSMLLTNWGTVSGNHSTAQMWVSIASQWVSFALYAWTLVAQRCCPTREFD